MKQIANIPGEAMRQDNKLELSISRNLDRTITAVLWYVDGESGAKSLSDVLYLDDMLNDDSCDIVRVTSWVVKWLKSRGAAPAIQEPEFITFNDGDDAAAKIAAILDFLVSPYMNADSDLEALKLLIAHNYHDCLLGKPVFPERARKFIRLIERMHEMSLKDDSKPFAARMVELIDEASAYRADLYCSTDPSYEPEPPKK